MNAKDAPEEVTCVIRGGDEELDALVDGRRDDEARAGVGAEEVEALRLAVGLFADLDHVLHAGVDDVRPRGVRSDVGSSSGGGRRCCCVCSRGGSVVVPTVVPSLVTASIGIAATVPPVASAQGGDGALASLGGNVFSSRAWDTAGLGRYRERCNATLPVLGSNVFSGCACNSTRLGRDCERRNPTPARGAGPELRTRKDQTQRQHSKTATTHGQGGHRRGGGERDNEICVMNHRSES